MDKLVLEKAGEIYKWMEKNYVAGWKQLIDRRGSKCVYAATAAKLFYDQNMDVKFIELLKNTIKELEEHEREEEGRTGSSQDQ